MIIDAIFDGMPSAAPDPELIRNWLTARSIVRGLPAPIDDHGGYRVDTNSEEEIKRWVFPRVADGLVELGRSIGQSRHLIKLCGSSDQLRNALPDRWRMHPPGYFMMATKPCHRHEPPEGYRLEVDSEGPALYVRATTATGELAAEGYACQTANIFIYDRITTMPAHRRRGLGSAVMTALSNVKSDRNLPEALVATKDGRALYTCLGWQTRSPYVTASIPPAD